MELMARTDLAPARAAPGDRISYEEFLERFHGQFAEWVDGEVFVMSPVTRRHAEITAFLVTLLRLYTKSHELGTVLAAPYQMRLEAQRTGREPDIVFVRKDRETLLERTRLAGPADVAVEVVSEESARRDRVEKLREYEQAGVAEYWLIDPEAREAIFYRLSPEGRYEPTPVEDGVFRSAVVDGFWLRVEWLWQEPPDELGALRTLGVIG